MSQLYITNSMRKLTQWYLNMTKSTLTKHGQLNG